MTLSFPAAARYDGLAMTSDPESRFPYSLPEVLFILLQIGAIVSAALLHRHDKPAAMIGWMVLHMVGAIALWLGVIFLWAKIYDAKEKKRKQSEQV